MTPEQQRIINKISQFFGQRVQIKSEAWDICKARYGYVDELTATVVGFIDEGEGELTLTLRYDEHLPYCWANEMDYRSIEEVILLEVTRELVTV